jgi:hypothetical protein
MVGKDQGIGGAILAVCVIVAVGFVVLMPNPNLSMQQTYLEQTKKNQTKAVLPFSQFRFSNLM